MEEKEALIKDGFAFTPFAIPFIAGPGSISSSMILSNSADTFVKQITFIISIFNTSPSSPNNKLSKSIKSKNLFAFPFSSFLSS